MKTSAQLAALLLPTAYLASRGTLFIVQAIRPVVFINQSKIRRVENPIWRRSAEQIVRSLDQKEMNVALMQSLCP